jgi:hypothetical protein
MKANKKPEAFLFDVDGTLANNNHRQQWVKTKPKNWAAYNQNMEKDTLILPVAKVFTALKVAGFKIICTTGREEDKREITEQWLHDNLVYPDQLIMRKSKDYRDDGIVKTEMLEEITKDNVIVGIFDDRPKVLRAWRTKGLFTFNVLQHEEEF